MPTETADGVHERLPPEAHVNGIDDGSVSYRASITGSAVGKTLVGDDDSPPRLVEIERVPFKSNEVIPKQDGRNYGSARLNRGQTAWTLSLDAHVAIMAKRLFPRLAQAKSGRNLVLTASEGNCEDLRWLLSRYPITVEACVGVHEGKRVFDELTGWKVLYERSEGYRERGIAARMIELGKFRMPADVDHRMALPPRPYQQRAAALLWTMGGMILADALGIGKTVSALTALADRRSLPALVICPPHLCEHWEEQTKKFLPTASTHVISRTKPYRLFGHWPEIIICSYHKAKGWVDVFDQKFATIVFDEAHQLRNQSSQIYEASKSLASGTQYRLLMSATPISGYGEEFFNVVDVARPGMLGTREEFKNEWCLASSGDRKASIKEPEAFGRYLRDAGALLRRTRKDVGREIPELTSIVHEVEHDSGVLKQVESEVLEYAKILAGERRSKSTRTQRRDAGGALDRTLRQATAIAKAPYVADLVRMMVEQDEGPILLFGWHRQVYEIWQDRLADLSPVMYTGSESARAKSASKADFISGKAQVLVMSLRSGVGLDGLQSVCSTTVVGELDWSPAVHEQGIGRIHRDGQQHPVFAYFAIAREGVDPFMLDVLGLKRGQLSGVIDPDREIVQAAKVDPNHIRKLAAGYLAARKQEVCV